MFTSSSKIKTAEELSVNTSKILNVFNSTISGLKTIIENAEVSISEREAEIKAAQEEKSQLETIKSQNKSIIEKIEAIIK